MLQADYRFSDIQATYKIYKKRSYGDVSMTVSALHMFKKTQRSTKEWLVSQKSRGYASYPLLLWSQKRGATFWDTLGNLAPSSPPPPSPTVV